jgi:hypothetical protein
MIRELQGKAFKWSTVCSTFLRSGWSIERGALLAKEGTLKKRPPLYLHKKVSPWTTQTVFV